MYRHYTPRCGFRNRKEITAIQVHEKNPRPEEALYIPSEWTLVSAMIHLPRMKLSPVTNKHGKVMKTINGLREGYSVAYFDHIAVFEAPYR